MIRPRGRRDPSSRGPGTALGDTGDKRQKGEGEHPSRASTRAAGQRTQAIAVRHKTMGKWRRAVGIGLRGALLGVRCELGAVMIPFDRPRPVFLLSSHRFARSPPAYS